MLTSFFFRPYIPVIILEPLCAKFAHAPAWPLKQVSHGVLYTIGRVLVVSFQTNVVTGQGVCDVVYIVYAAHGIIMFAPRGSQRALRGARQIALSACGGDSPWCGAAAHNTQQHTYTYIQV